MPTEIEHIKEGSDYITLKEAAELSGYSSDYLGQLIRKGKLSGKQVYLNVAWMTTKKDLQAYLENNKPGIAKGSFKTMVREKARRWTVAHMTGDQIIRMARKTIYLIIILLIIFCLFLIYAFAANLFHAMTAHAATGVPKVLSYQGRLFDSNGNLLGGAGTQYCFRFSIFDGVATGSRVWPAATASIMTATVQNGVFDVGVGDVSAGGDALTYDFQSTDTVYLDVQVATKVDPVCTGGSEVFESLKPRERIVASGYAINSYSVGGFIPSQNASGSEVAVLTGGDLDLGDTTPNINALGTSTLTLQGGTGTGAIQFFNGNNFINGSGTLTVAGKVTGSMLQATATSSQLVFQGTGATGTISWNPTVFGALTIPNFATASDTLVLANFTQTLNNKTLNSPTINTSTLNSPTVFGGMSLIQNAAATGFLLMQNATGSALAITDAPTSTQATSTVSIITGTNVTGAGLFVQNYGTGDALQVDDASSSVFFITGNGNTVVAPSTNTSTAFSVENASQTDTMFAVDTLNNDVKIGNNGAPGSVPTLLGLDTKSDALDPAGFNGAMYYSSSSGAFRCDQAGTWYNCVPTNMQWQPVFFANRWGYWAPSSMTATSMSSTNLGVPTVNGTGAASAQAEDFYVQYTSGAVSGNIGGLTEGFTQMEPRYTPRLATRIRTDTGIANRRIWFGINSATITGSDEPAGASSTVFMGLRYSTAAGDTNWMCGSGDGTNISYASTTVKVVTSTYYDILLDATTPGQLNCEIATNGGSYVSLIKSNNIPTSTQLLGITDAVTTLSASGTLARIAYVYMGSL